MRVLHLIDPGTPGGGATTLHLLAEVTRRLSSVRHHSILFGSRAHAGLAERCGLAGFGRMCMPRQIPMAGRRSLSRLIAAQEIAHGPFDLIHSWDSRSVVLAALAAADRPRLGSLAVGPTCDLQTQFMLALLDQRPMPLLVSSSAVKREYSSLGLPDRLLAVLPPAVNPESAESAVRADLRRRWEVSTDIFVIGLLSEPVSWADARTAATVASRVAVTGRRVKLLVHPSAAGRMQAERWSQRLNRGDLLIVDDDVAEPWRVVSGMDAALLMGGGMNSMDLSAAGSPFSVLTGGGRRLRPLPGVMPLLWAMAAGLPVVAETSDAIDNIVQEGRSGTLVAQHDINAAADRISRLYDDRTIAGRLGARAAELVNRQHHISAYCVRLKDAYERLLTGRAIRFAHVDDEPLIERFDRKAAVWTDR